MGVSRSIWKASITLANILESTHNKDGKFNFSHFLDLSRVGNVLELGSGPGLGGIFASALIPSAVVVLTDICTRSLQMIEENFKINKDIIHNVSANYLEWGKLDYKEYD